MEILKSKSVFFSPARKTGDITSLFVSSLGYEIEKYRLLTSIFYVDIRKEYEIQ